MHSPQPLSTSVMTSQSHSTPWRHNSNTKNVTASARGWGRNRFEICRSALEPISITLHTMTNTWLFVFISRVIRWNFSSKMWRISLPRILQNNDLQCYLKTAGVITNDGFLECIILYNALCTMDAGETMHCKPCYDMQYCFYHSMKWFDGITFCL